jgi:large subunit ribosomal protein L25
LEEDVAEVKLTATKREGTGKGFARRTRMAGRVPAVVYGHGMTPLAIEVDRREFVTALHTDAGMNVLLDLDIEGEETTLVLTKDLQRNPVRGTLLHADFIKIDRTQEVEVEVPLHVVGEAPGVGEGGVLEHPLTAVLVRSLATEVPGSVDVDISSLNIGDSLRISDLAGDRSYEILTDPETIIASVSEPVSEAELQALEEDAGVVHEETDEEAAASATAEGEAGGDEGATSGGEDSGADES